MGIKEVAKYANVSISTVSNVINGKNYVSAETKLKVEKAIQKFEYEVNPIASGLKSSNTRVIGVVLYKFSSSSTPPIMEGIHDAVQKYGYDVNMFATYFDFSKEKEYINRLRNNWVDGIIVHSCCDISRHKEYARYLSTASTYKKQIPVVSLERAIDPELISSVTIDNEFYSYKITKYLIDRGHRHIAYISGPMKLETSKERLKGYKRAIQEEGCTFNDSMVTEGNYTPVSGYNLTKELIGKNFNFTALVAVNDQTAIGAIKALKDSGCRVPEDIAVVGFDNAFPGTLIDTSLTTVSIPLYNMGFRSVEILVERIKNSDIPVNSIKLECDIIIRRSSDISIKDDWQLSGW